MQKDYERRRLSIVDGAHLGLLSVSMLLNGYSYFIPRLHEAHANKPLVGCQWDMCPDQCQD